MLSANIMMEMNSKPKVHKTQQHDDPDFSLFPIYILELNATCTVNVPDSQRRIQYVCLVQASHTFIFAYSLLNRRFYEG
jgi:hypothetical protein